MVINVLQIPYNDSNEAYDPLIFYDVLVNDCDCDFEEIHEKIPFIRLQLTPIINSYAPEIHMDDLVECLPSPDIRTDFLVHMAIIDWYFRFLFHSDTPQLKAETQGDVSRLFIRYNNLPLHKKPVSINWNPFECWLNQF
jgi:hypothetical protein